MNKNILLCGVGGQGTVLASKLLAAASMKMGLNVVSAETIGMAQKGGSVTSYIRIGGEAKAAIFEKGTADLIIAFEPAEGVRMLPYLKNGGAMVVNSTPIIPVTAALSGGNYSGEEMIEYLKQNVDNITVIDGAKATDSIGSSKALNMVLLGSAVRGDNVGIDLELIKEAMKEKVKPQFFELNCKALEYEKV